jgi:ribonuclease VapC
MVVDTSVLVAILLGEPERFEFYEKMRLARNVQISAVNYVECAIVLMRYFGPAAEERIDRLLREAGIAVTAVGVEHTMYAIAAFRQYGKGRHPAGLNFGDCFSYALAKSAGEPLLFKGSDFSRTDVRVG